MALDELRLEFLHYTYMVLNYSEYRKFHLMMLKKIEKKYNSLW